MKSAWEWTRIKRSPRKRNKLWYWAKKVPDRSYHSHWNDDYVHTHRDWIKFYVRFQGPHSTPWRRAAHDVIQGHGKAYVRVVFSSVGPPCWLEYILYYIHVLSMLYIIKPGFTQRKMQAFFCTGIVDWNLGCCLIEFLLSCSIFRLHCDLVLSTYIFSIFYRIFHSTILEINKSFIHSIGTLVLQDMMRRWSCQKVCLMDCATVSAHCFLG